MNITKNIEDYLQAIFNLTHKEDVKKLGTNQLADYLGLSPASVSVMIKKMKEKQLVDYERYGKIELTKSGHEIALKLIRKHRLWETFLHQHMNFSWDEVHEVAHQLEHIHSPKLIRELDNFLGNPKRDPHGDPIPDKFGNEKSTEKKLLSDLDKKQKGVCVGVKETTPEFLQYLDKKKIGIGIKITVLGKEFFDGSMVIQVGKNQFFISKKIADNLYVI